MKLTGQYADEVAGIQPAADMVVADFTIQGKVMKST